MKPTYTRITVCAVAVTVYRITFLSACLKQLCFQVSLTHSRWTTFATNVTKTANALLGKDVALQGIAFAESSHTSSGFSPEAAFDLGILDSDAGSQVKWCASFLRLHCNGLTLS